MGILTDQLAMADATVNARKIAGQKSENWVQSNLTLSQVRTGTSGNLLSGYWPGSTQGGDRAPSMYPDNNNPFVSVVVKKGTGREVIKDAFEYSTKTKDKKSAEQTSTYSDYLNDYNM